MPNPSSDNRIAILLLVLLSIASVLLAVGLLTPLMTIKTLVFMRQSFSILSGIYDLWREGKYFLFVIITLFSVGLPIFKIIFLAIFILRRLQGAGVSKHLLQLIHDYGRWAMLDVMVVAVLLVTVKLGAIASVEVHPGLYIFGTAVLLIMLITDRAVKLEARGSAQ